MAHCSYRIRKCFVEDKSLESAYRLDDVQIVLVRGNFHAHACSWSDKFETALRNPLVSCPSRTAGNPDKWTHTLINIIPEDPNFLNGIIMTTEHISQVSRKARNFLHSKWSPPTQPTNLATYKHLCNIYDVAASLCVPSAPVPLYFLTVLTSHYIQCILITGHQ